MKFCVHCGRKNHEDAGRCCQCGTRFPRARSRLELRLEALLIKRQRVPGRSILRALLIGAALGLSVTGAAFLASEHYTIHDSLGWWFLPLNLILGLPALSVLRLFGITPAFGPQTVPPWTPFMSFAVFTNMVVCSTAGAALAWIWGQFKAREARPAK
jgi:hypothetical protein